jgi:RHS repeat-associated protein
MSARLWRVLVAGTGILPLVLCLQIFLPSTDASAATTYAETTGGLAHTWTNYTNAGGTEGPTIPSNDTVQIACRLTGFKVADGNTWWYQIASSPWNDVYYVSADPFYNNGATSGPLKGTPFFDPNVPICGSNSQGDFNETTGGVAHTWTNYADAGGTEGPEIGSNATVAIACRLTGFAVADGNTWWYLIASAPWDSQFYVSADAFYNNGQTSGSLLGTPFVDPNVPICSSSNGGSGSSGPTYTETTGGVAHTWSDYSDGGGTEGPEISAHASVQIACKVTGLEVPDGNTWWYQIASSPWNGSYYVSADPFYNDGATSGSLIGTPFVDTNVPDCSSPGVPKAAGETSGPPSALPTFTDYTDAGGPRGPSIPVGTTVTVDCRVTCFAVADGDSWWYLIGSSPWNSLYYASADGFYNNGQTSGSLQGTPFYDASVPLCAANQEEPDYATAVGSSSGAVNGSRCNSADPVDCASGDFWQTFTDVSVPGRGPALDLTRTYNALDAATAGIFGNGWSSSYDQHLTFNQDGSVTVTLADGSQVVAEPNGSGGYVVPQWADSSLTENGNGTYTYTRQATEFLTFASGAYDASGSTGGQLLSIGDLNGYTTTLAYNQSGQLSSVTDSSGRSIDFTFGSNGFVSSVTDPMGRTTNYGYDSAGDLTSVTDPMGRTWDFGYNTDSQMVTMTDPLGGVTTNAYNSSGQVTAQTDPQGLTTTFAYTGDNFSALGGTTTITDPHGNVEVEQYANGFMTTLSKGYGTPAAGTWNYTYDPNTYGVTSVTGPDGNVASYTYNSTGQVLTSTDPLGDITSYTYNSFGEVLTKTDPLGNVTTNTYDANGNLLSTTDPMGDTTVYSYGDGSPGDVTAIADPSGHVTTMTYDSDGDLASRSTSPGPGVTDTTTYTYDADGELVCQTSPVATADGVTCPSPGSPAAAGTTATSYDADGEVTSVTNPDGGTTYYSYDAEGNQVQVTDPSGKVTSNSYDDDNRLVSTTAGVNGSAPSTTAYAYDLAPGTGTCQAIAGATYCTTTTNPDVGVTTDYYNSRDELIDETLPGGQSSQYAYDAAGNKTTMTNAAGQTATYGYDADYHLTSVSYSDPGTPNVTYTYDADGRRTSMTDGTGTTTYSYDADSRLTSVQDGAGSTVSYGYDAAGDVTSVTYPGGNVVTRTFDGAGELASVTDWLGNTTTFGYDNNGNLTTTSYPNGDTVTSAYNGDNALISTSVSKGGTTLASISYTRNADDLISTETDSGALTGTTNYAYSAQNQLISVGSASYAYDQAGNLTSQAGIAQDYNAAGQLTTSTTGTTTTSYTYDADGDLVSAALPSGTATGYSYNQLGELIAVTQTSPVPAVTALSAAVGPDRGGTTVTITGSGFTGATSVSFGNMPAGSFTVNSDTQITTTAPAGGSGTVDVTVTTAGGTSTAVPADQFSYLPIPAITAVMPDSGPVGGGATVTITGTGLTDATAVDFGGSPASSFTVNSATQITATAPSGTPGSVDVMVKTPGGTSPAVSADQYTYAPAPAVTNVMPAVGPEGGQTAVTITGTGFTGATAVSFGGQAATSFTLNSGSQITATAPAGTGTVDIIVTTPGGTSSTGPGDQFTYLPAPAITGLGAQSGPTGGGNAVAITGTGFTGATAVDFGGHAATSFTVLSATQISATAPAQSSGTVDVTVTTPGGVSAAVTADKYAYLAAPAVTGISPSAGPVAGGTKVTITGTGLAAATGVSFGGVAAASFTVVSATQITATAPAEGVGTVDITVTTPGGTSVTSSADNFTYAVTPAVTKISPAVGAASGGTTVTITGTGLTGATAVSFGDQAATHFAVISGTEITATAPAESAATVAITVTTPGGVSPAVPADQFAYTTAPAVTSISPQAGPLAGGTNVTITGSGFSGATAVTFGTVAATSYTIKSATQIIATAPSEATGTVDVTVTTPGGISPDISSDQYTYAPGPAVSKVSTSAGPIAGGTAVTITGTGFTGASAVSFGSVSAASYAVVSSTQITATAPAQQAGTVDVTVTTPGGISPAVTADQFSYLPEPAVTGIAPPAGPASGGTAVTITGTGLASATAVSFGTVAATSFTVVSSTQLAAVVPAQSAGTVDVTVSTPGGTSSDVTADHFTYAPLPAVTKVTPSTGLTGGGTTVTITGSAFTGATAVNFGSTPAATFTVTSATQITATAPAHATGTVDITVTTPGGTSPDAAADHFIYDQVPAITKISPSAGPAAGGTAVTITGTGFTGATAVAFGAAPVSHFTVVSSSQITATAPAHKAGTVTITVTNTAGIAVQANAYTYAAAPALKSIKPASGPTSGGTKVTITGTAFTSASAVKFGTTRAPGFTVTSSTTITATSPSHPAGTVNITVTTAGGTTPVVKAGKYAYTATKPAVPNHGASRHATASAAPVNTLVASYTYNGDGLRMNETTGTSDLTFTWDTTESTPELLSDGNNAYIYGPGGLPIEQIDGGGSPSYFLHDANGSTLALLNDAGSIGATFRYSGYGALSSRTGSLITSLLYGEGYTDPVTGFVYLVNRYYDPETGSFISMDPALAFTNTPYSYADDDPINGTDPLGEFDLNLFTDLKHGAVSSWQFVGRNAKAIGGVVVELGLGALDIFLNIEDGGGGVLDPGPSGPSLLQPSGKLASAIVPSCQTSVFIQA